jgi:hypothetical protein
MKQIHLVVGVLTIVLSAGAAVYGVWCWWQVSNNRWFWRLLRASQVAIVVEKAGFESAQEVGALPDAEQREIVRTIMRREIGVMALAALVNTALLARAAMTH